LGYRNLNHQINILIADDHKIVRQGLRSIIESENGLTVIGEASDGSEAVDMAFELKPDVILMDIMMPVMDGIAATQRIKSICPEIEIVVLTGYRNETYQREAFASGARAYLLKEGGFEGMISAIRHAYMGEYYLSGSVSRDLVSEYIKPMLNNQHSGGVITRREKEIAKLLADGYSTKEAAKILNISPRTAETHRASIMKKLDAKNVADIVKYCIRNHIIEA